MRASGVHPSRLIGSLTLGALAAGCTTWRTQSAAPEHVIAARNPDRVRVTRPDGSTVEMIRPLITGDTLLGSRPGSAVNDTLARLAIPLSDVRSVAVQQVSAGRTVLLLTGVGLTAIAIAAAATNDPEPVRPPSPSDGPPVSCPLVYSWDGSNWRLDSGTFGGAIAPALARTDVDNLVFATTQGDSLRLRVANELSETDYLDELSLLVVDHPLGATVAPDASGRLHTLGALIPPRGAHDFRGRDALARVEVADGWSWESNPSKRDPAVSADIRDGLELVFARPAGRRARLVLDGSNTPWASHLMQEFIAAHGRETQAWYDSLKTRPGLARSLGSLMAGEGFLGVSVWADGQWQPQGYFWEVGPEILKRQVFGLDLSRVEGDSLRIRVESAPSFWLIDHVALDTSSRSGLEVHEVRANSARTPAGTDIRDLLRASDGRQFIMETGEGAELTFRVPPTPAGRARSYLIRSSGWYRIHGDETAEPDIGTLAQVYSGAHGASRVSVQRLNAALLALQRSHQ